MAVGVRIIEKTQGKSASNLTGPNGAMAIYAKRGATDKAYLMDSEEKFLNFFGYPHTSMALYSTVTDIGRSMLNALNFIKAGMPMYIKRAIPSTSLYNVITDYDVTNYLSGNVLTIPAGVLGTPVIPASGAYSVEIITVSSGVAKVVIDNGLGVLSGDGTGTITYTTGAVSLTFTDIPDANVYISYQYNDDGKAWANLESDGAAYVRATAVGHGTYYNGLALVKGGINSVTRKITLSTSKVSLGETAMPGTIKFITSAGVTTYASAPLYTTASIGAATATIDYEDDNYSDNTTIVLSSGTVTVTLYYETTEVSKRNFRLYLVNAGETSPKSNYIESYQVALVPSATDSNGTNIFIESVLEDQSNYITANVPDDYITSTLVYATDISAYVTDALNLNGGGDGVYAAGDADISTALNEFLKKKYDIIKMFDAGFNDNVKARIASVCRQRKFPVGFIDPSISLFLDGSKLLAESSLPDAQDLVDWRLSIAWEASADLEFVGIAGSTWGLISDTYNNSRKIWMPPTYLVGANAIVDNNTFGAWESIMGPRRGITGYEKLAVNFYDDVDILDAKQVNPLIINERGIQMFYGDSTCELTGSPMQQLHARITRGYITRELYFEALDWIAEGNVSSTWNEIENRFTDILDTYGNALESYKIVVGPPKTTDSDLNNQILRIGVGLIFNGIAKEIIIETTVFKNGTELDVSII